LSIPTIFINLHIAGGGEKEARAEHEEIHRRRRVLIERYLDKRRQEGKDVEGIIGDPSDCVES
jgi:hypothetical protein